MIVAVLFTVFIIGPVVTSLNLIEYIRSISYLQLFKGILLLGQSNLPGVFTNNTYPTAVNGSLWTLLWEAKCYLITAIFGLTGLLKMKWPVVCFSLSAIIIAHFELTLPIISFFINTYSIYYLIGSLFAIYNNSIKYTPTLLIPLFLIWILSFDTPFITLLSNLFLPYIILYVALKSKIIFPKLVEMGDFSYGVYIYAFPLQQSVVNFFQNEISPIKLFIISFPLTIICSYFSWNLIEKKALHLKDIDFNIKSLKLFGVN